mmetsp:Transcript_2209/g.5216  ORF Transcript_2209/g.5216 Transcript_2209/m.5216 type:complete len:220 (+) Transcript_2209:1061-1720(+)
MAIFMIGSNGSPSGSSGCRPASARRENNNCNLELHTRGGTVLFAGGCSRHWAANCAETSFQRAKKRCASRVVWSALALLSPSLSAKIGSNGSIAALASPSRWGRQDAAWHNACNKPAAAVKTWTFLSARVRLRTTPKLRTRLENAAWGWLRPDPGRSSSPKSAVNFCSAASRRFHVFEYNAQVMYSPNNGINGLASIVTAAAKGSGGPRSSKFGTLANG